MPTGSWSGRRARATGDKEVDKERESHRREGNRPIVCVSAAQSSEKIKKKKKKQKKGKKKESVNKKKTNKKMGAFQACVKTRRRTGTGERKGKRDLGKVRQVIKQPRKGRKRRLGNSGG